MPSKSAKTVKARFKPLRIIFVVYPDIKLLDLAGPLQVFNDALSIDGKQAYQVTVASIDGKSIQTDTCINIDCDSLISWQRRQFDTLIIVGGNGVFTEVDNARLKQAIVRMAGKARRVGSICTGAFLLAACGLLDGRRVTTHWEYAAQLAKQFPQLNVEQNPIFINDKQVWTSAGVTAGIDMSLAMLSEDNGRSAALKTARALVTYFVRPGGQSQFSETLAAQTQDTGARFDQLHAWMQSNLHKDLRVEHLAHKANMSSRHFSRVYLADTGTTPAKAIEAMRVESARRLLEEGKVSVSAIARRCGFGDDERMRRSFVRLLRVPPQHYRRAVSRE